METFLTSDIADPFKVAGGQPFEGLLGTGTLAGDLDVTATIAGPIASSALAMTIVPGIVSQVALTGATTDLASGGSRTLTATLQDAAGNTVPTNGTTVTYAQTAGAGTVTGLGTANTTNGVATLDATGGVVGTVTVRSSITTPSAFNSNTLTFGVVPGGATQVSLSAATSDLMAGVARTLAGLRVTDVDVQDAGAWPPRSR